MSLIARGVCECVCERVCMSLCVRVCARVLQQKTNGSQAQVKHRKWGLCEAHVCLRSQIWARTCDAAQCRD